MSTPSGPSRQPWPSPTDPQADVAASTGKTFMLRLRKRDREFRFTYEPGGESEVLRELSAMASNGARGFDWFDAAVLSHQLGEHLSKELGTLLPKKAA